MTKAQTDLTLTAYKATFVSNRDNIEWWRLPDGSWLARRVVGLYAELRHFPASACNC